MAYKTIKIWVPDKVILEGKDYTVDGKTFNADLQVYNDAFYTVISGIHKGNLIHTFNVKK